MDAAISRFDTFQKFPKVMDALGFSTEESDKAIRQLSNGIDGLPTKLDDVVGTSQRMTAMTGNLNKSTQATLALNNAFLASGASTSDAQRGTEQYIQQLAKGEVDLQSWRTLQESMSVGLQMVAKQMGFTGEAATTELYGALKSGKATFREFQENLIQLGTGTGELASLARINSEGIATSFANLQTAMSRGLANVIQTMNDLSESMSGKSIAQHLDNLKVIINSSFSFINKTIKGSEPVIKGLIVVFNALLATVKFLSPVIGGLAVSFGALMIVQKTIQLLGMLDAVALAAGMSGKALTLTTSAQIAAQVASTGATKADMLVRTAANGQVTLSTLLLGTLTGAFSASTIATTIMTTATTAFGTAIKIMLGPIGWAIAAIGLLTAGAIALWKWWKKDSEEAVKLKNSQEKLAQSSKDLASSTEQAMDARGDEINYLENSKKAHQQLADEMSALSLVENKSAGEKKMLAENVEMLNREYAGLNLKYDEESGLLSMTADQIKERIELYAEQGKINETQQQLNDILMEQMSIGSKISEITSKREEWNQALEDGSVKSKDHKNAIAELDEQEQALNDTLTKLGEEQQRVTEIQMESAEIAANAVKAGAEAQIITYEGLSSAQQSAVDSMRETYESLVSSATNAFDKINTKSELSLNDMVKNLQHNQKAVEQWGDNQAKLLAWAGENGHNSFIPFIESIGVDQAGVLAEMVKGVSGTNAEQAQLLEQLASTYESGFGTAAEAGKEALSLGLEGLPNEIRDMVITPTTSLNEEVRVAFQEMGQATGEGAAKGIENSSKQAESASGKMASDVDKAFAAPLGIHSPSRVFIEHGNNLINGLVQGISNGVGKVKSVMTSLTTTVNQSMNAINTGSNRTMTQYVATMTSSMSRANAVVNQGANQMRQSFTNLNQVMVTQSNQGMTRYSTSVTQGMNRATQAVNAGNTRMRSQFSSLNSMIASQTQMGMNRFVSVISSGMNRGVSATNSGRSRMNSAISGLNANFYNSGYYASLGLANGIYAGSGSAMAAARSVANRVAATMKSALKINSPSHVTRDEIGRFIPEGVAVGIDRYAHKVDESMEDMAKSVTKKNRFANIKNAIPRLNGLINGDLKPEFAFGVSEGLLAQSKLQPSVNNSTSTKVIENSPQVTMHVTWKGKEDIRRTMEAMGWIVNVDDKGAME
jgi:tape measure domain-containing protein